jgi:hypothetical protein
MAGRKKTGDTSERVTRINITLKPSQIEWLKSQGGVSETISKMTDKVKGSSIEECARYIKTT